MCSVCAVAQCADISSVKYMHVIWLHPFFSKTNYVCDCWRPFVFQRSERHAFRKMLFGCRWPVSDTIDLSLSLSLSISGWKDRGTMEDLYDQSLLIKEEALSLSPSLVLFVFIALMLSVCSWKETEHSLCPPCQASSHLWVNTYVYRIQSAEWYTDKIPNEANATQEKASITY